MEYGESTSARGATPVPLIKSKNDNKSDKCPVNIKLRRNPTSEIWDPYEFKMDLFDNGKPGGFLLFIRNSNMTLEASGNLVAGVKIQLSCTMLRG